MNVGHVRKKPRPRVLAFGIATTEYLGAGATADCTNGQFILSEGRRLEVLRLGLLGRAALVECRRERRASDARA